MRYYEYCFLDTINNGTQYVRFERRNDRPNDPMPDGAVLRERDIARPQEQTGTYVDEMTGEPLPIMSPVADKYCKWNGTSLEAMTQAERDARDVYDADQAVIAETTRQAAKPDNLKRAENAFLQRLAEVNAQFSLDLTTDDGFQDALEKLKASTAGTQIDRLQAGMELNTLWSVVLADGGQWGDVAWHDEVAE